MELENSNQRDEENVSLLSEQDAQVSEGQLVKDPQSHTNNKKCKDSFSSGAGLTRSERKAYTLLKRKMAVMFDVGKRKHSKLLQGLTYELFQIGEAKAIINNGFESDNWGTYGFQGKNPITDFRGGGVMGLRQIINFRSSNEDMFEDMVKLTGKGLFLYACNSISVTFFLKEFFHMGTHPHINKKEGNLADRTAFKSFCTMLAKDKEVINELHELVLSETFKIWEDATRRNPDLTIMDMGQPDSIIRKKFKQSMSCKFSSFTEFSAIFKAGLPDGKAVKKMGGLL